jgi:uncharacterized protein YkwD
MGHFGFSERCDAFNGMACAENVAYNWEKDDAATVSKVHDQWMTSSGHRANIMNTNYNKVGYAYTRCSDGKVMWTGMYGKK